MFNKTNKVFSQKEYKSIASSNAQRVGCKEFKPIFSKTRSFSITLISYQSP